MGILSDFLSGIPTNAVLREKIKAVEEKNASLDTENAILKDDNRSLKIENQKLREDINGLSNQVGQPIPAVSHSDLLERYTDDEFMKKEKKAKAVWVVSSYQIIDYRRFLVFLKENIKSAKYRYYVLRNSNYRSAFGELLSNSNLEVVELPFNAFPCSFVLLDPENFGKSRGFVIIDDDNLAHAKHWIRIGSNQVRQLMELLSDLHVETGQPKN